MLHVLCETCKATHASVRMASAAVQHTVLVQFLAVLVAVDQSLKHLAAAHTERLAHMDTASVHSPVHKPVTPVQVSYALLSNIINIASTSWLTIYHHVSRSIKRTPGTSTLLRS